MKQLLISELSGDAVGRRVRIYRNLSPRYKARGQVVYSVMDDESGLVLGHATDVSLADATFRVSAKGRERVLRTGRKAVHAVIVGTLESFSLPHKRGTYSAQRYFDLDECRERCDLILGHELTTVRYNPFKCETFCTHRGPLFEAPLVRCSADGVEAWLP